MSDKHNTESRDEHVSQAGDINEYYERYWDEPEDYNDPTTPQRQALLRKYLQGARKDKTILDVGCGRGEFCRFFQSLGLKPVGIDISNQAIQYARQCQSDLDFRAMSVDSMLPDHAKSFHYVFSSEVIEHLFNVDKYLASINQLLVTGGIFILTTPYHGLVKNILIDLFNYSGHYDPVGQHIRFFDRKGLTMCMAKWGFKPVAITGYGRPWPLWKSFFVVSKKIRDA